MVLYCPNCGAANEEFAQYCASCGDDLSSAREKKSKKGQTQEEPKVSSDGKPKKELLRSRTDRKIAGVSAGLAKYFNMDVDHVRILWILAFVMTGGSAAIAYLIMAMVIEEEPEIPEATST